MTGDYLSIHFEKSPPCAVEKSHSKEEDIYVNLARIKEELGGLQQYKIFIQEERGFTQFPCFSRLDVLAVLDSLTETPRRMP